MKKLLFALVLLTTFILGSCNQKSKVDTTNKSDITAIKALIKKYAESIDNADSVLGSKLFAHTNEVSFIHPGGHEKGWQEVSNHIYKLFGDTFSKRKLNFFNENITVYNGVAWAEFYWVFDGTFKKDNSPFQSRGRETQIWKKNDNEWHLVHVHYSDMPLTGEQ
ncbi:MAG: nuclear transport factor 2 family protein [Bacteroidia bacterium]|nr:nuclear transport factor 2 family protein [Bacteroidia bacterium]